MLSSDSISCSALMLATDRECVAVMLCSPLLALLTLNTVNGSWPFKRLMRSCLLRPTLVVHTSAENTTTKCPLKRSYTRPENSKSW